MFDSSVRYISGGKSEVTFHFLSIEPFSSTSRKRYVSFNYFSPPLIIPQMSNEYTISSVPPQLLLKIVNPTITYEFLNSGDVIRTGNTAHDEKQKNHLAFKLTFKDPSDGPLGVRLAMDTHHDSVDSNEATYAGSSGSAEDTLAEVNGQLNIKEFNYSGPSNRAISYFSFRLLRDDLTLRTILDLISTKHMDEFKFGVIRGAFLGCRDWQ
jgi:hypothetical protein